MLLLDNRGNEYNLVVSSTGGRQHFEDTQASPIELTASLYKGSTHIQVGLTYEWHALTDGQDNILGTGASLSVSRDMVYSEEKFLCKVTNETTGLEYTGTIDIWDQVDKYTCIISSDYPLILSENFSTVTLMASVFDEKGELIQSVDAPAENEYYLTYQWGYATEGSTEQIITNATNKTLEITPESPFLPRSQDFLIFCRVSNTAITGTDNNGDNITQTSLLAAQNVAVKFIPSYETRISPQNFFITTGDSGTSYEDLPAKVFEFNFQIVDKNGNPITYDTGDSEPEQIIGNENEEEGIKIEFEQKTVGKWDFTGKITLIPEENPLWEFPEMGSKTYEFSYLFYGQVFTEEINIIKNKTGKSNYSIVLQSSSGSTLMDRDTETVFTTTVYYNSQVISNDKFQYVWYKDGVALTSLRLNRKDSIDSTDDNFYLQDSIIVLAKDFQDKAVYRCDIYPRTDEERINPFGSAQYSLVDLTETLPISLILKSSLGQNIQIKTGDLYSPNFDDSEFTVTPSLFIGKNSQSIPVGNQQKNVIYYQVGEFDEHGVEKNYKYNSPTKADSPDLWVDDKGILHYSKNLIKNLTIEAYIDDYKIPGREDKTKISLAATNPINIMFLESGGSEYIPIIESGGREHFEEDDRSDITLTAYLYKGNQKLTDGVNYEWDIVTDSDTSETEEDDKSNLNEDKTDFISHEQTLTVGRSNLQGSEIFICKMTLADGSNLSFTASKTLRDFTDEYYGRILSNSSTLLTPNHKTIILSHQIFHKTKEINSLNSDERFKYSWSILSENKEEILLTKDGDGKNINENNRDLKITLGKGGVPLENGFTILAKATIDNKINILSYLNITYQPVIYTVEISPKTIIVPAERDGSCSLTSFEKEITFKLVDSNKTPLSFDSNTSNKISLVEKDSDKTTLVRKASSSSQETWNDTYTLKLDTASTNNLWSNFNDSKTYEVNFTYLNENFTEEFEIVKGYAGLTGQSAYTVDLSNEFYSFAGSDNAANFDQETECYASAFWQDTAKNITNIYINNASGSNDYLIYPSEGYKTIPGLPGLFFKAEEETGSQRIKILIRTKKSALNESGTLSEIHPINFYIGIQGITYRIVKTFNYNINYNSNTYYLEFNSNTVTYENINNTFTPSFITPSALSRGVNGEAQIYSLGIILYAYDLGNNNSLIWTRLGKGQSITNFPPSVKNIKVRLYTTQANDLFKNNNSISHAVLISTSNDYYKYLVDVETIPVLESAEGYEFGGENLLRWSKTLPVSTTKWRHASVGASVTEDSDDFSVMNFDITGNIIDDDQSNDRWYHFFSPKIPLSTEMIGSQFCLSFWIKFEDFNKLDYASLACIASVDFEGDVRNAFGNLGYFVPNDRHLIKLKSKSSINQDEWCECYTIFTLNDSLMTATDNKDKDGNKLDPTKLEKCKYFRIGFYIRNNAVLQIKKPKLEMGNIPTSWSASPYDVDYENVSGANLISNGYRFNLTTTAQEIYSELRENTIYTLSWDNIEPNGTTLYIKIGDKDQTAIRSPYTFDSKNARSFTLKSNKACTVKLLKLEIGNIATPFIFDQSQLDALFSFSSQGVNNFVNAAKGIIGPDGKLISIASEEDLENLKNSLGQTISDANGKLEVKLNSIASSLYLMEQKINVGDSYNGQLAITLSTNAANIKATKLALTSDRLAFLVNNEEVAYLSNQRLNITHAVIEKSLQIGNIKFIPTSSGTAIVAVKAVG